MSAETIPFASRTTTPDSARNEQEGQGEEFDGLNVESIQTTDDRHVAGFLGDSGDDDHDPASDREQLAAIYAATAKVDALKVAWDDKKLEAANAKTAYEKAVGELVVLSRKPEPEDHPLFNGLSAENCAHPAEAWRAYPLSVLGLQPAIIEALSGENITTIGRLSDHTKAGKLRQVPGIGDGKLQKINEALESFFSSAAYQNS